jgi:hypothetical protein
MRQIEITLYGYSADAVAAAQSAVKCVVIGKRCAEKCASVQYEPGNRANALEYFNAAKLAAILYQ